MPNAGYYTPPRSPETDVKALKAWTDNVHYNISDKNHQTITSAVAVNIDARFVRLKSSGSGYAVTLAAPTIPGIYKVIQKTSNNSDNITMSLTNCFGQPSGTTVTWNSQNDIMVLVSCDNRKWYIVSYNGVAFS